MFTETTAINTLTTIKPFGRNRLRARRVNEELVARWAAEEATQHGIWHLELDHGGTVANNYGYAAETEWAVAISDPEGNVKLWCGRIAANKVTKGGVVAQVHPSLRPLFDGRYCDAERLAAVDRLATIHED